MLVVSRMMVAAALEREESRGTHLRLDFPKPDAAWRRHIEFARSAEGAE
jgi:L-aspartate oxidase